MRENELKFAPSATFALPEFGDGTGVDVVEKLPGQNLRAVYYDTGDLRLARLGATLRHRTGEKDHGLWTLKLPIPGDERTAREEIDSRSDEKAPPSDIVDLTTAFIRSDTLVPVTTLRTKRQRWVLRTESGSSIAELVDDDVSVIEGRKIIGRFRELEVEQKDGSRKQLKKIADALREAGAVDAEPIPKASRALALRPDAAEQVTPPQDDSAGAALARYIKEETDRLILHDPVVRLGRDEEGVHQMRVATRRIRSNIKTFSDLLDSAWSTELATDLKWLAALLGEVRDLDVLQHRLRLRAKGIEGLKPLFDSLTRQHRRARTRLLEGMRSERYRLLIENLVQAGRGLPVTDVASDGARSTMGQELARLWSQLASDARSLSKKATDEQQHNLRIQTKRLRYAVEAAAPCFDEKEKDVERFKTRLADIQDVLGKSQDAAVSQAALTSIATRGSKDPAFCVAVGRMIERESQSADRSRAMFTEAWGKLDRKKNLTWLPR